MPRSPKPPRTGAGALTIGRDVHRVRFEIRITEGAGRKSAKGGLTGAPEAMRRAFREGLVSLALDDGKVWPVTIVAHAEGDATAYFESAAA